MGPPEEDGAGRFELPRKILVATAGFPPGPGGSATVMCNLLSAFRADDAVLALHRLALPALDFRSVAYRNQHYFVSASRFVSHRLDQYWRALQVKIATRRITRIVAQEQCGAVVGVYPDLFMLRAALDGARAANVPFVAYLHDTLAETTAAGWLRSGEILQRDVFRYSARILALTEGMQELYLRKYGLNVGLVPHAYPETLPGSPPTKPAKRSVYWSGNVYGINDQAVRRAFEAVRRVADLSLTVTSLQRASNFAEMGLDGKRFKTAYFPSTDRAPYLRFLSEHGCHLVALNWPDECGIHEDELSTIFPTKVPEYLASARPILVHCPEHYYLARFFRRHGAGLVVSERSVAALSGALERILSDRDLQVKLGTNALRCATLFSQGHVAERFRRELAGVF